MAALGADFGFIDDLHLRLLAVDVWPTATSLRVIVGGVNRTRRLRIPPGRWTLTDTADHTSTALGVGGGGSDAMVSGEVELDRMSLDDLPWTVRLHLAGEDRHTVVDAVRPRTTISASITGDVTDPLPAPADAACRTCGAPSGGAGVLCVACRRGAVAVADLRKQSAAGALPSTEALALDTGDAGLGCFLSLERWPRWWTLRHHLARDWKAVEGGLRGRWRADDGIGPPVEGYPLSAHGSPLGWTSEHSFPGTIDPASTEVALTLVRARNDVARVVVPVSPTAHDEP